MNNNTKMDKNMLVPFSEEKQRETHTLKAKVQENFLKSIEPLEVIKRINEFRKLNIRELSEKEISNAILKVLCWNDKFSYITNICTYPSNTSFFRIRKLVGSNIPNVNFNKCSDFWEPPQECVKKYGRLNKEGESLLYVTPGDPHVALKEMHIKENDFYALIKYASIDTVKVNVIGGEYNYDSYGITNQKAVLVHELYNNFLKDEFSRDVGEGTEYLYKVSEIIAKWYFDLPPKVVQDAWAYNSVQDKEKYNVCFRPEIAHSLLDLQGALICKKDKSDNINVCSIAVCEKNKMVFYQLGSEQQKSLFPEISII
jgi:hypothetical protein